MKDGMYKRFWKRGIDLFLSTIGIIVLMPIGIILSLTIIVGDPGPVFFLQKRVGRKKNATTSYFSILKFRTMKTSTPHEVPTHMLDNPEQYITRIGRMLRKTSLDELPQIFNIWIGQMSIVGPRPALWNQFDLISLREQLGVNDVMPGLTGWAQVNGRDELDIEVKAQLDGEYARNISFRMDWTCFWMTVGNVLKRKGVVEGGTGVMNRQMENRQAEIGKKESNGSPFSGMESLNK